MFTSVSSLKVSHYDTHVHKTEHEQITHERLLLIHKGIKYRDKVDVNNPKFNVPSIFNCPSLFSYISKMRGFILSFFITNNITVFCLHPGVD